MRWKRSTTQWPGDGRRAAAACRCCAVATGASTRRVAPIAGQDRARGRAAQEGQALVALADAAMAAGACSDFAIGWRNDFFKAQTGTFVPVHGHDRSVEPDRPTRADVCARRAPRRRRRRRARPRRRAAPPFDIILPVRSTAARPGQPLRITRGFALPPGDYDVYCRVARTRAADPLGSDRRLKAAVLKQPLTVPDFWTGDLTTSTVMLADRI